MILKQVNTPLQIAMMTTFILLNTASLQLIPSSMIALRAMYGSLTPSSIVIPIWIVTSVSLVFGIIFAYHTADATACTRHYQAYVFVCHLSTVGKQVGLHDR